VIRHRAVLMMKEPPSVSTDDSDSKSYNGDDAQCRARFSDNKGETRIQQTKCFLWSHEKCGKRRTNTYTHLCILPK
jgi:hypothetical protein